MDQSETDSPIDALRAWVDLRPGRASELAQILGVSTQVVVGWLDGSASPAPQQERAIDKMLRMDKAFRCSLPVFQENEDEHYAYSFAGSGFVVRFKNRLFILTAKHVRELILDSTTVRIWVGDFSLPFNRESVPQSLEPEADFAILEIDQGHLTNDQRKNLHPLDLDKQLGLPIDTLLSGAILAMRGFPDELYQVHYDLDYFEKHKLTPYSYSIDGRYDGAETTSQLHRVRYFAANRPVTDHSGMSGSPWIIESCQDPQWDLALVGLHVRGNQELAQFIRVDLLLAALNHIVESSPH